MGKWIQNPKPQKASGDAASLVVMAVPQGLIGAVAPDSTFSCVQHIPQVPSYIYTWEFWSEGSKPFPTLALQSGSVITLLEARPLTWIVNLLLVFRTLLSASWNAFCSLCSIVWANLQDCMLSDWLTNCSTRTRVINQCSPASKFLEFNRSHDIKQHDFRLGKSGK